MTQEFNKIVLYRMVTPEKTCPYGLKAKALFEEKGWCFEDHILKTRAETDAFKHKYNLETTPLIFIDGKQIGGYSDLLEFLGQK
ncbi:glutaredoxin [Francisella philomiragia]|uniref:Glutaredoxin family protein n=1 Tax=Francisella philomiragia TaxID=28110 RepID=A0AAW3DE09_9GAMM|nr:glutaredoxin domain-containing protein [Francisella philomiragia]KFJ43968.1 glutaredoxin family protein [Francisella philomiragia]MBK2093527.1 glutaredoxin [Francisella philomiragia]MBK2106623.1 glutaredoxin [Francisella philomiragia]MBK2254352.1 glutaredoxin [Francisella philomiragia]MBK2255998.1 glutaredoxin [Francisella philomiragia]